MPMWAQLPPQPAPPVLKPDEPRVGSLVARQRRPRAGKAAVRRFADPFSNEDGANCLRCGYLVEPAREKSGLMTCSGCG
jgi:hypothetical protein